MYAFSHTQLLPAPAFFHSPLFLVLGIALPLYMLRGLHIRPAQKVGLAALFLICVVDIVFDILRAAFALDGGILSLNILWNMLEPIVAVIVCALPTYRGLLAPRGGRGRAGRKRPECPPWLRPATYRRLLSSLSSARSTDRSLASEKGSPGPRKCDMCGRVAAPPPPPPPKDTDVEIANRHRRMLAMAKDPATIVRSTDLEIVSERFEDAYAARLIEKKTGFQAGGFF